MERIKQTEPKFGDPRITARAVELFKKWCDAGDDDYAEAAEELTHELHQPPWEYSALDCADQPEPSDWMLKNGRPHYASWRAGCELFEALAKAAGIPFIPSADIAAHSE